MEKPIIFPIMRHSDEAETGAEELIRDIKTGRLKRDIDPFLKSDEFLDNNINERENESFSKFLESEIGQSIIDNFTDSSINRLRKN